MSGSKILKRMNFNRYIQNILIDDMQFVPVTYEVLTLELYNTLAVKMNNRLKGHAQV